jgi:small-conductance mechanosensitive channel
MLDTLTQAMARPGAMLYLAIVAVNLILMLLARPIIERLGSKKNNRQFDFHVNVLRGLNLAILTAVCYYAYFSHVAGLDSEAADGSVGLRIIAIPMVLYLAYLAANTGSYLTRRHYGKVTSGADGPQISDTYHSRMLTLLLSTFIAIVALIWVIRLAGFSSMLEAGGAIGFVGVFLALTQAAWAPDIISGLVLLNSDMVSEGDLIEIEKQPEPVLGRVFKTKIFHTVLIDVVNNHRVMISNSRLREQTIHSLSKFASARGLREKLVFKIGYDTPSASVKQMFQQAFASACEASNGTIDETHPLEIRVLDAGDHAVAWGVFYYIKEVQQLVKTRQLLTEEILEMSRRHDISLATPQTHVVTTTHTAATANTPPA